MYRLYKHRYANSCAKNPKKKKKKKKTIYDVSSFSFQGINRTFGVSIQ